MAGRTQQQQGAGGTLHSYSIEEKRSFSEHINDVLANDQDCKKFLKIDPSSDKLFEVIGADGIILCKLVNKVQAGTIADKDMVIKAKPNTFEISQNMLNAIQGARKVGCKIVNIGPEDLKSRTPHLILGLLWQIIRIELLNVVNVNHHPEIVALMADGEDLEHFIHLAPEETLLRWFNYHLQKAGSDRKVNNFGSDVADSKSYLILLHHLDANKCSSSGLNESDPLKRAELMLKNADALGCRKFVTADDVVHGNTKLNLAFIANLFNHYIGLDKKNEDEEQKRAAAAAFQKKADEDAARLKAQLEAEQNAFRAKLAEEEARMREKWAREDAERKAAIAYEEERRRIQYEAERKQAADSEARKRAEEEQKRQDAIREQEEREQQEAERRQREEELRIQAIQAAQAAANEEAQRQYQQQQQEQARYYQQQQAFLQQQAYEQQQAEEQHQAYLRQQQEEALKKCLNGKYTLQTAHHRYLCAEDEKRKWNLIGDRTKIGGWETWTIKTLNPPSNQITIQSPHGRYLCTEPDHTICQKTTPETWTLEPVDKATDVYNLKSAHGRYLCSEDEQRKFRIIADRSRLGGWEKFTIKPK